MTVDLAAARRFMAGHARLLDRRRFDLAMGTGGPEPALATLDAYRNDDGGYGWGLEPDLRAAGSQPITALHAFDVWAECKVAAPRAASLCDWLATVSFGDGGLPFVLPIDDPAACAPWFAGASSDEPSLHGTTAVVGAAWRTAAHDAAVAAHPWLGGATRWCLDRMTERDSFSAYETLFALRLLDAVHDTEPDAPAQLARLAATLSPDGTLAVEGGVEGEVLRPLDYAPSPGTPVRSHVAADVVEADLDRVAGGQHADGGWTVEFASFSPAAALEWRGDATVRAITLLADNGRLG